MTTDWSLAKKLGVPAQAVTAAQNLAKKRQSDEVSWAPQMRELLKFKDLAEDFGTAWAISNLLASAPEMDRPIVADVFTRKAYTQALKSKSATDVAVAMRALLRQIPHHGDNAVLSTDKGREFSDFDRVLPGSAVLKHKQTINDLSVVDRQMQSIKKGLEDGAQNYGENWAGSLKKVTYNYNETPHETIHGAPNTAGDEGPQQFMIMQDQARNFAHNRQLTVNRKQAIEDAGGFREPVENGTRSFKPAYGELHDFKSFVSGGDVQDSRGHTALLKLVRPAGARSGEA
jgi:hypothetical protein